MSSPVAELDSTLTSMLELKPPGVSGAKITSLTALCNTNVQVRLKPCHSYPTGNRLLTNDWPIVRVRTHPENLRPLQKGSGQ